MKFKKEFEGGCEVISSLVFVFVGVRGEGGFLKMHKGFHSILELIGNL